mgnify:CR=1 FL=1
MLEHMVVQDAGCPSTDQVLLFPVTGFLPVYEVTSRS